ncbi:DUF4870 domain-containing protein [Demequina sp. NBRC 110054]|uniref:DUF4870 domain-containing protein n=1 Tax=Demequina sp. NBRC 110054 TaxID=1570343 RepID=UPI0013562BA4|nr:DUF4870 domain-containing protein [Demequina sp. NBRC 110054]
MNDTDRTEGVDETPDAASQDAAGTPAEGVSQPPALEAGPTASSTSAETPEAPAQASTAPAEGAVPPPASGSTPQGGAYAQGTVPPYQGQQPAQQPYAPQRMLESEARNWSMLIHIIAAAAALLSAGTVSWLVPLIIWLIFRERSALIDHHGKQALNLQLTLLVVLIGGVLIGFVTLFIGFIVTGPLMVAYGIYAIVISFVAGVKANNGEYYRIPLMIPFLR